MKTFVHFFFSKQSLTLFIFIIRCFINWGIVIIVFQFSFFFQLIDAECIRSYIADLRMTYHFTWTKDRLLVSHWCVVSKIFMLQLSTWGRQRLLCSRPDPLAVPITWLPFGCTYNRPSFQNLFFCSLSVYTSVTSIEIWAHRVFLIAGFTSVCPAINTICETWFFFIKYLLNKWMNGYMMKWIIFLIQKHGIFSEKQLLYFLVNNYNRNYHSHLRIYFYP